MIFTGFFFNVFLTKIIFLSAKNIDKDDKKVSNRDLFNNFLKTDADFKNSPKSSILAIFGPFLGQFFNFEN